MEWELNWRLMLRIVILKNICKFSICPVCNFFWISNLKIAIDTYPFISRALIETPLYLVLYSFWIGLKLLHLQWETQISKTCHFITIVDDCKFLFQLDVVSFANLAQIYFVDKEVSFPLRDFMQESCANLAGLVNRMKEK